MKRAFLFFAVYAISCNTKYNENTEYNRVLKNPSDFVGTAWWNSTESTTLYFQDMTTIVYRTFQGDIYLSSMSLIRSSGNYTNTANRIKIGRIEYFSNLELDFWETNAYAKFLRNEEKNKRWRIIMQPELINLTK